MAVLEKQVFRVTAASSRSSGRIGAASVVLRRLLASFLSTGQGQGRAVHP